LHPEGESAHKQYNGDTGNDKMAEPATVQVAILKLRKTQTNATKLNNARYSKSKTKFSQDKLL